MESLELKINNSPERFHLSREGKREIFFGVHAEQEKIEQEIARAKEQFADLITMASQRYNSLPKSLRESFVAHNAQILEKAIEFGVEDDFSKEDLHKLEIAAILHDIAKADQVEERFRHIPNYVLVTHAERAAAEVPRMITDEFLRSNGFMGEPNKIREDIQTAILQHMGPHPGFMTETLSKVNEILLIMGEKEIIHPQAEGKISEALLAADMYSLATAEGRAKVLEIRSRVDKFKQEDEEMARQCSAQGVSVSAGEIALISGYDSAQSALSMVENEKYRKKIMGALIASKYKVYDYQGRSVEFEEAFRKVHVCRTLNTLYH